MLRLLGIHRRISRQIALLICGVLFLVMSAFVVLVWYYAIPQLPLYAFYILIAYTLLTAIAILGTVGLLVRYWVRLPLEELTTGLKKAQQGDFLFRLPVKSENEIGQLAENFNHMMARFTNLMASQMDTERVLDQTQAELALQSQLTKQTELVRKTNEELQARIKYLSLLYDIGNSINSIIEPDHLYQSVVRIISEQLGFDEFAIYILDPKMETLEMRACHGFEDADKIRQINFQVGEGICGIVAQTGKRQLIRDTAKDKRYLYYKGHHRKDGSFLCIPLKVKGSVLGTFNFFRPQRNGFSAREIRLLTAIANQAAIAIENAQLFNNTRQLSVTDELTGLANRRHFKSMLELEKKRSERFGKPMSILMVDVDNFKKFNDTHGHLEGDHLLKRIAQLLSQNIREVDLIARFGGEEFIILLTNVASDSAQTIAEKLREIVDKEHFRGEDVLPNASLTISIGFAAYPEDTRDVDELENLADVALYEAKRKGKNQVIHFHSNLLEKSVRHG